MLDSIDNAVRSLREVGVSAVPETPDAGNHGCFILELPDQCAIGDTFITEVDGRPVPVFVIELIGESKCRAKEITESTAREAALLLN